MNSTTAYILSKKYTEDTAESLGSLKGAPCTIKSKTAIEGGTRIVFSWTGTSGTEQTTTLDVMDGVDGQDGLNGQDGLSVVSAEVDTTNNHLILTMSDSSTIDCGEVPTVQGEPGVPGAAGEDGFSPSIEVKTSTSELYILTITNKDGSYDTPNLKGGGGSGGASALSDLTDVALVGVSNGQILKYNATTHKWENSNGIEIDSISDIDDVEITNIQDNQILIYDAVAGKWKNVYQLPQIQFSTMVEASTMPQAVVQYIGNDTADYKRGFFYRSNPHIESGSVVYEWGQLNVQPSNSDYEQLSNHPEIENVELVGNKTLDDLGINGKFQYSTLPTATVSNAGKIVQYIGTTTADYKKGFWYQSAYDSETSEYVWKNIDVSSNTQLATRIAQLETNQGDMSQLEIVGVSDIVAALNALNGKGLSTITYTEPNLILTYEDGTTKTFNVRDSILNETQIGELANVTDTTVANGNVLQYDSAILGYKPYDILAALTTLLTESKDYTDQEIASSLTASAYVCDAKPQYDSVNDLVIYFQNGQAHTTDKTDSRFYYTTSDGSFCSSWIEGTEFTFNVAQVDYDDYVNKNTDVVSTYTEDMADKSKIPDVSALDALLAIVKTALALKINTASIVDALTSQDATKVLSANQGYVIKGLIDDKNDKIQFATMPSPASALSGIVYQYVGSSSQAFVKGHFYTCLYDNTNDEWYWSEIKYAADTDSALSDVSENPVQNKVIKAALDDKQDSTLTTPLVVEGITESTVETALSGLNTEKAKKFQLSTMPSPVADLENIVVQFIGNSTVDYNEGSFYKCKEITPATDPKTYEWVELTSQVELDDELSPTSTNGIENRAVTGALQALQAGVFLFYDSESVLPSTLDYAGGVIVALNSVAYCVLEQTFHYVSAIDSSTLAITWSPYIANIATLSDISKHKNIWIGFREAWNNLSATERKTYDEAHFKGDDSGIDLRGYQKKQLDIPLPIGGATETTVEGAIGALDSEVDNEIAVRAKLGAHNFVALNRSTYKPQYAANLSSITDQTEDTVTVTSIAADYAGLRLYNKIAPGEYIVSYDFESDDTSYVPAVSLYYSNSDMIPNGGNILKNTQRKITVLDSYDYVEIRLFITRASDAVIRTGTFKNLMFRLATDTDITYQPFTKTNKQLTDDKSEQSEVNDMNNILGAKNIFSVGIGFNEWFLSAVNGTTPSDKAVSERVTGTIDERTNSLTITSYDNSGYYWPCKKINLEKNTDYKVTYGAVVNNAYIKVFGRTSGQSAGSTLRELTNNLTFNSGNYDEWWIGIYPVQNGVYTSFEQMMIRPASITDDTYVPYAKTNQELTKDVQPIPNMLNDLGAKNLLHYPFKDTTQTVNGVIFTDNGDGSISVNGTANAEAVFLLTDWNYDYANAIPLLARYILNGNPSGFDFSTYFIQIIYVNSSNEKKWITPNADETIVENKGDGYDRVGFRIVVKSGTTVNNVLFKPMLRYATINDNTYTPYAKTNRELTDNVNELLAVNIVTEPSDLTPYLRSIKEGLTIQYFNISKSGNVVSISATVTNSTGNDIAANEPLFYFQEMPKITLYSIVQFITSNNFTRINLRDSGRVDLRNIFPSGESFAFAFTYISKELHS